MSALATLLVVCVGNICRSPMAQALFGARLPGVDVQSAGLGALVGHSAEPYAVALMRERGLDIAAHRARLLTPPLCAHADLILTMEREQKHALERRHPSLLGRVFTLGEFCPAPDHARQGFDVPDPYCGTRSSFERSLRLIEHGVDDWCARLASATQPIASAGAASQPPAASSRLPD
ncbi:low molecular weight protein-tyrosine-phosphatase [Burkholderia pyrrocinia]|uniref:low molecular weight protein-tyrosine-phosphatase n=1 Tax=Burkholderia pyrrocinia TaxID=60550 RepID=UPI002AB16BEA|nr:low molecular weight protein-tyrosine-phosphatase [Burkholderia pyrrocinia]